MGRANKRQPAPATTLRSRVANDGLGRLDSVPLATQLERLHEFYGSIFERVYDNHAVQLRDIEQLQNIAAGYKSCGKFITDPVRELFEERIPRQEPITDDQHDVGPANVQQTDAWLKRLWRQ